MFTNNKILFIINKDGGNMRLRNVKNASNIISESKYVIKDISKYYGCFNKLFNNNNSINLEIGMGKGNFLIEMAKKYPDINFIGVERYESVIVRAVQKIEKEELNNIYLMNIDAKDIDKIFNKEIDTLYLNFSDPWPKKKHEKRRLTSNIFLDKYDKIFVSNPHIIMKTDNINLFAYSLVSLSNHGYIFNKVSLDLTNEEVDNVLTEYESKFMSLEVKINYLDAIKRR